MSNNGEYAGRLSERGEVLVAEDPENHLVGRFSEGQEVHGEEDPEKHRTGELRRRGPLNPAVPQLSRVLCGDRVPRCHGTRVAGQRLVAPILIETI